MHVHYLGLKIRQTDMNVTEGKTYKLTIITITRYTLNELPPIDDKVAGILEHICMDGFNYIYDLKLSKIVRTKRLMLRRVVGWSHMFKLYCNQIRLKFR